MTTETARPDEEVTNARDDVIERALHVRLGIRLGEGEATLALFWMMASHIDQLTERIEELEARA